MYTCVYVYMCIYTYVCMYVCMCIGNDTPSQKKGAQNLRFYPAKMSLS